MEEKYKNRSVNRSLLYLLAQKGYLKSNQVEEVFDELNIYPAKNQWFINLERALLSLGTVLMLSGAIFFFAYNWNDLSKFFKLGLVQGVTVIIALFTFIRQKPDFVYQMGLTVLSVLVGINFTVFGQIYQTGADAYDLFIAWTLLITIWVAVSNFPPLWLFYLALLNITITLYFGQILNEWGNLLQIWITFIINALAVLAWEFYQTFKARWFPRVVAAATAYFITLGMIWVITNNTSDKYEFIRLLVVISWLGILGGTFVIYTQKIRDLFMLVLAYLSGIVILNTFIIDKSGWNFFSAAHLEGIFLLCSGLTIGLTIGMVRFLIQLNKKWKETPQ